MPATFEPCPTCKGLGHVCKDEEPFDHIHEHAKTDPCKKCGGRGSVPIKVKAESALAGFEE